MKSGLPLFLLGSVLFLLVAVEASPANNRKCLPGLNCKLPYCRCWDDTTKPGNINDQLTPQMILLTFSHAINENTVDPYLALLNKFTNPNNCSARATFFAQYRDTSATTLRKLHAAKHEFGITSSNGQIPHGEEGWLDSLTLSLERLTEAGIPKSEVKGVRASELYMGGNDEFNVMANMSMGYEASCITEKYTKADNLLWPFTRDYTEESTLKCASGKNPDKNFPGIWQFPLPVMEFKGTTCVSLSSCSPLIHSAADAFELLFASFRRHYELGRTPMVLYVDPMWMTKETQVEGLMQFLEVIRMYPDTWMLTMSQALDWVKTPFPMYDGVSFYPWECSKEEKRGARR